MPIINSYHNPILQLILSFLVIFLALEILLGLYHVDYFKFDIVKEPQIITLAQLEPNTVEINVTQGEVATRTIVATFTGETVATASLQGFDLLNKNESKKVINLIHDDIKPQKQHFFYLSLNPNNDSRLFGTFEGYAKFNYDSKDNKNNIIYELLKIELKIKRVGANGTR
jgi:hypothetical protein